MLCYFSSITPWYRFSVRTPAAARILQLLLLLYFDYCFYYYLLALASAADTAGTSTPAAAAVPAAVPDAVPAAVLLLNLSDLLRTDGFHPRTRHFTRLAAISTKASW